MRDIPKEMKLEFCREDIKRYSEIIDNVEQLELVVTVLGKIYKDELKKGAK
jgi:hypothetical protein